MAENALPGDPSELVLFISSYVRNQFEKTGRRTGGAALAEAIRQQFPGRSYEQLGVNRLADAVQLAEKEGRLVRHRDVTHLEVSPSESTPQSPTVSAVSRSSYVRPDIWRAFVFITNRYAHFLDRTTGRLITVAVDSTAEIQSYRDDRGYIRIESIAPETQQEWMRQFVASRESLDLEDAPIDDEQWWIAFPSWLQKQHSESIQAWRRFRAERVMALVRTWAAENAIPQDTLFAPPRAFAPVDPGVTHRLNEAEDATKCAIIEAIKEMPFEQLQDLAIPVRYILRHFRAR